KGELGEPTSLHVDTWVKQFDGPIQISLLQEVDHVLRQTYVSRDAITGFLTGLVTTKNLAGSDPCAFWSTAHFLDIQQNGHSQAEMLALFDIGLKAKCGISIADCGKQGGHYIYLDDVIFSGNRVGNDLSRWIEKKAPS